MLGGYPSLFSLRFFQILVNLAFTEISAQRCDSDHTISRCFLLSPRTHPSPTICRQGTSNSHTAFQARWGLHARTTSLLPLAASPGRWAMR